MSKATLPPRLRAKLDNINHYELPVRADMVGPAPTIGPEYHRVMLDELSTQAEDGSASALWAIEMIVGLYEMWAEAVEGVQRIKDLVEEL